MSKLLEREKDVEAIRELLAVFPVTALLGPRQAGKTTLAKTFQPDHTFDLENPRDLAALENPQLTLEGLSGLVMIDEVQRRADLFPLLRYLVDTRSDLRFLLLGSASSNLRQQSGESLAGRIGYYYLSGFNLAETGYEDLDRLWLRGGFPRSFLAASDKLSRTWRSNFISTFLERDLAVLGQVIPSPTMYRFWTMLSHYHGQTLNYSELGRSFGISDRKVKQYISLLEDTFMLRLLLPWRANLSKRLVKSPKLYIRDSGIFHSLQSIESMQDLRTNPKLGASWEGFALEELVTFLRKRDTEVFFYATHHGVELDLYWQERGKAYGAEFKYQDAPRTTRSMWQAIQDLDLEHLWVIYPGNRSYALDEVITVVPLREMGQIANASM